MHADEVNYYRDNLTSNISKIQDFSYNLTIHPLSEAFLNNITNQSVYDQFLLIGFIRKVCETDNLISSIYLYSDEMKKVAVSNAGIININEFDDNIIHDEYVNLGTDVFKWYSNRF